MTAMMGRNNIALVVNWDIGMAQRKAAGGAYPKQRRALLETLRGGRPIAL
jgi:hypothetical protein